MLTWMGIAPIHSERFVMINPVSKLIIEILGSSDGTVFAPRELATAISYRGTRTRPRVVITETIRRHLDRWTQNGVTPLLLLGDYDNWDFYLERVESQRYRVVHSRDVPIGKCTNTMLLGELRRRLTTATQV